LRRDVLPSPFGWPPSLRETHEYVPAAHSGILPSTLPQGRASLALWLAPSLRETHEYIPAAHSGILPSTLPQGGGPAKGLYQPLGRASKGVLLNGLGEPLS